MKKAKKPVVLNDRQIEGLAYFFHFFWCVVALAPGKQRAIRGIMADFGLVEKKGPLALSRDGKRVLAFALEDDRPRYPAKKRR